MDKNYVCQVLTDQANEWYNPIAWGLRERDFLTASYRKWAIEEALDRIDKSLAEPKLVIWEFMNEMNQMTKIRADTRMQFEIARDTANCMLDIVEAMGK